MNIAEKVKELIDELKINDLELILVSNNNEKRLSKFCSPCSLRFLSGARKPSSKKLNNYLSKKLTIHFII